MLARKSKISSLLKKEREKERLRCEKECSKEIRNLRKVLENKNAAIIKNLKADHKKVTLQLRGELRKLRNELEKNHSRYVEIRLREKELDELSSVIEVDVNKMITRVHESIQPFYRTMAKVDNVKRNSDKKHEKIERIFSIVNEKNAV